MDETTPLNQKYTSYQLTSIREDGKFSLPSTVIQSRKDLSYESRGKWTIAAFLALATVFFVVSYTIYIKSASGLLPIQPVATIVPFSFADPRSLGFEQIDRPEFSRPGKIFGELRNLQMPLPTNSWCENLFLGSKNDGPNNKVFQLPYIIDTAGIFKGLRAHSVHVQANDRTVMMTYEDDDGITVGAAEAFNPQHEVAADKNLAIARLSVVLQWKTDDYDPKSGSGSMMYSPIVRGAPYISMVYENSTPRIYAQRALSANPVVDGGGRHAPKFVCGTSNGKFSQKPVLVQRELLVSFGVSDMTWLIFVSEPTEFVCSNQEENTMPVVPGDGGIPNAVVPPKEAGWEAHYPHFELRATKPMKKGMVRIAVGNNCTLGENMRFCERRGTGIDQKKFIQLLRDHAETYPSGNADIAFAFPPQSKEEDEIRLSFDWFPGHMARVASIPAGEFSEPLTQDFTSSGVSTAQDYRPAVEVLMYAIPHHQERLQATPVSSNEVLHVGCIPTLHGTACPVIGSTWSLIEHLHRVSFHAVDPIRPEMLDAVREAIETDILYELPINYRRGAGDTYFAGKMLAKLARIIIIADEIGGVDLAKFDAALDRLRSGVEIWINGSASAPLLYDMHWGGLVSCGCDFDGDTQNCRNSYPNCPALVDAGQNFGHGFYNDHHFHYGYHIYAAAVVAKFDYAWARKHHEQVLTLVRDIANPSPQDPYFPTWRHKDWYLGFSWASGIVTIGGDPYPNGRNQESSSESISAYEAVALYGATMAKVFSGSQAVEDIVHRDVAHAIADMGRLLFATEVRSARLYWHVQAPESGVARIYPAIYTPRVVGMVWSLLAQEQTWFGNEPYKSYGIQLMPLTVASEIRDTPGWVEEMLPFFNESCAANKGCTVDGWSVLIHACLATAGRWQEAWQLLDTLSPQVYEMAGGNGHSRTNSLWFIATRPDPNE